MFWAFTNKVKDSNISNVCYFLSFFVLWGMIIGSETLEMFKCKHSE